MTRTITVKARRGAPYTVTRRGQTFGIARATPDNQFVHRLILTKRDAYGIANALIDLAEGNGA